MLIRFSKGISSHVAIGAGMICLTLSHLTERFLPDMRGSDFTAGLFLGLSLTMLGWGLYRWRAERARTER